MISVCSEIPALLLAPMDGATDPPMRAVQGELGAFTFAVSEFLRVSQSGPIPRKVFLRDVPELLSAGRTASGLPVQVQILGGGPRSHGCLGSQRLPGRGLCHRPQFRLPRSHGILISGLVGAMADKVVPGELPGGVLGAVLAGWLGFILGHKVLGDFGPSIAGVYLLPAFLGAVVIAFLAEVVIGKKRS